jgi:hypothetical protein
MNANDGTTPFFALSSATELKQWKLDNNTFAGCHDMTLAPAPTGGVPGFDAVSITNNFGCNQTSYTSSGNGDTLTSTGNSWGSIAIAGNWGKLTVDEAINGAVTDSATGTVCMSEPWQSFTPVLKFGGAQGAWTNSGSASYQRTLGCGFNVRFGPVTVTATDAGTTGVATLTGLPLTCKTGVNPSSVLTSYVLTGVTTDPSAYMSAQNYINLKVAGSGSATLLTNAQFNALNDAVTGAATCTQTN